jgi:hypothetical protein
MGRTMYYLMSSINYSVFAISHLVQGQNAQPSSIIGLQPWPDGLN